MAEIYGVTAIELLGGMINDSSSISLELKKHAALFMKLPSEKRTRLYEMVEAWVKKYKN
jgi:hypothetical protein